MPTLDVSELNIVISILGLFIVLYGVIAVKIKQVWYLGEALPAVIFGIALGPLAAKFIDAHRWGSAEEGQQEAITLGLCRVVIGVQLVMAGYQLPSKYQKQRWREMLICLLPVMTIMWLCTAACILLVIPKITLLSALVIGSCVTCTDPILSQAVAKGPFADKYVHRHLREIISSEAGVNDGFGFPFLLLSTFLIRHAELPESGTGGNASTSGAAHLLMGRSGEVGRLGGGVSKAIEQWVVECWLYFVLMSIAYGVIIGLGSCHLLKYCLRKKWIDSESYLLWPTALGLFLIGTCGSIGTDDLLACFVAGHTLNWNGQYLAETEARHDEVNSSVDVLLNFGGFMYIGTIIPWSEFQLPDLTGITVARLMALGFLVLVFRRIPAIFMAYKFMPAVVKDWKEALFMGYFGPIGIGAVFYVEHTRHLFPEPGEGDEEENNLTAAMVPVVYFLVIFSMVVHGLSIPALNLFYKWRRIPSIQEDDVTEIQLLSTNQAPPKNSSLNHRRGSVTVNNRFSRQNSIDPKLQPFSGPAPQTFRLSDGRERGGDEESMDGHSQRQLVYGAQDRDSRFESTDDIIKLKAMV